MNGGNVGMVERGEQSGFTLEPRKPVGILGEISRQYLDRDIASEFLIVRAIDLSHTAFAERFLHIVMRESSAGLDHGFGFQFRTTVMGDVPTSLSASANVLMRNRSPSGETSYCCLPPATPAVVAIRVWNSGTAAPKSMESFEMNRIGTDIMRRSDAT